ncbi:putative nucleoside diphosphate-linked moiety X motif 8 mitochondrial [Scophthalmus maximus]|uniref:Putative nucleoside diphosphate-linked moiety X motif 8 mitochondrial n=1 Tax=Scophthalmus maximus TaxID=52904 RepID=A0A2U9B5S8_SCOMX|nr:putative nucleoside diphosphate-linked moiety X motif 8 mitochondrial [Scophthalmus maximus]
MLTSGSRMFRGPQILTWSCPTRSLLRLRTPRLSYVTATPARGRSDEGSPPSEENVSRSVQPSPFSSDRDGHRHPRETSSQNPVSKAALSSRQHHAPWVSTSKQAKHFSDPWKCTVGEDSGLTRQAVSTNHDCLTSTTCLQAWRRFRDFCHVSLGVATKTRCNLLQSHFCYRHHFARHFSTSQISNHVHGRPRATGHFFQQTRGIQQASPRVADAWRDCLSPENENRCRQILRPNLKLYDSVRAASKGGGQRRHASVLVSLCSVEGQPALLFTLRSTMLGRNKGDVSFAGGKNDPSDRDVVATALRETREELGVNVAEDQVWGVLKPLRDMSGMLIAPVLANLGPLEELSFTPNPGEVEEVFTLSFSHLCNPQNCGYTHFRTGDKYGYTLPVFHNGKHRVWGLTAVALDQTLKLIVPP